MRTDVRGMTIRQARRDELGTVADLWNAASARLGARGLDQWQYPVRTDNIRMALDAGTCWIIEDAGGVPIGTVTVDDNADPQLWVPSDGPADALYLHRLVVLESHSAREVGSAVIDWASRRAHARGKRWLRLDAWTSNEGLHRYYLRHGFRHVRTVVAPAIISGALFERPAGVALGRGPAITEAGGEG